MIKLEKVGDRTIAIEKKCSFDEYIKRQGISLNDFNSLKSSEKENTFLKWKWGSSNNESNRDCQATRNFLFGEETDESVSNITKDYERDFVRRTVKWERMCKQMGLRYGVGYLIRVTDIKTEDNYHLCSLYMHLRKISVKFNPYQKMLREISFHVYPEIPISKDKSIGTLGSTGNALHPHLHFQLELRDNKGNIVAIDPAKVLGLESRKNISSVIKNKKDFNEFYQRRRKDLHRWKLEKIWS